MNIGKVIYGFCNGYFGRDDYETKRIEAEGADWIVARPLDDPATPRFAHFDSELEKDNCLSEWTVKPKEFV